MTRQDDGRRKLEVLLYLFPDFKLPDITLRSIKFQ